MKNVKLTFLMSLLALSLAACGGSKTPSIIPDDSESTQESSETTPEDESSSEIESKSEEESESTTESESEEQSAEGVNIVDFDHLNFSASGDNGEATVKPGEMKVWTESGSTGSIGEQGLVINHNKGGNFWSTQLFYREPYFGTIGEHKYHLETIVNVEKATSIDVNFQKVELAVGDNEVKLDIDAVSSTILIMFGDRSGSSAENNKFTFKSLLLTDVTKTTRYDIKFMKNDGTTLHDEVYALQGHTLWRGVKAPQTPSAEVSFMGWKDGETKVNVETMVPTRNMVLTPVFEQVESKTITVMHNSNVIDSFTVPQGTTIPSEKLRYGADKLGFGKAVLDIYTDSGLNTKYTPSLVVNDDLTLYVVSTIKPSAKWCAWDWAPDIKETNGVDSYKISGLNCGTTSNQIWEVQINFQGIPNEAGYRHTLSFTYKLAAERDGHVSFVKNNAAVTTIDEAMLNHDGAEHIFTYSWDASSISQTDFMLSLELGQCGNNTSLEITAMSLTKVAL